MNTYIAPATTSKKVDPEIIAKYLSASGKHSLHKSENRKQELMSKVQRARPVFREERAWMQDEENPAYYVRLEGAVARTYNNVTKLVDTIFQSR